VRFYRAGPVELCSDDESHAPGTEDQRELLGGEPTALLEYERRRCDVGEHRRHQVGRQVLTNGIKIDQAAARRLAGSRAHRGWHSPVNA
jgi:hypothetical protein